MADVNLGFNLNILKRLAFILGITVSLTLKTQTITTVAGNGISGFSGDNGLAKLSQIECSNGIVFDPLGNLYFADNFNHRIRKINTSGIISTLAGNGSTIYAGDGVQATATGLYNPAGIAFDTAGNLYISDQYNFCIRKVDNSGVITTVAGNGSTAYNGDGIQATTAGLFNPAGIAIDASGNLYIADVQNHRIRKVDASGIITTFAGTGVAGYGGDGGLATSAQLDGPYGLTFDAIGNLYIADWYNHCIRMVNTAGIITTVAGNGTVGYSGDGGAAVLSQMQNPSAVAVDVVGNMYITEYFGSRVRKVNTSGIITTLAGNGTTGYNGDNIQSNLATVNQPIGIACDAVGNVYISDCFNYRIRKITMPQCVIGIGTSSALICSGQTATLTASGASSYSWNPGGNVGNSIIISPTITTNYSVTGTNTLLGCTSSTNYIQQVNPNPIINTSTSTSTICVGQSATLNAVGASNYNWLPGGNGSSITISPTVTTSYSVVGTNSITGCSNTSTITQFVSKCLSVLNNSISQMDITIYPNPHQGQLYVDNLESNSILVYNVLGQKINTTLKRLNEKTSEIIFDKASQGVFVIQIFDEHGNCIQTSKIIVEN